MEKIKFHNHGEKIDCIIKEMPTIEEASKMVDLFSLLADNTRLRILWLVCHMEECVTNIGAFVGMSAPAVSHHLRFLRQAGIIVNRKIGKETYYRLADNDYASLVHKMVDDAFHIECRHKAF